jgi:hypothetical protein
MAGRPPGATNKDKPYRDALRAEIASAIDDNDYRSLRKIAREQLKACSERKMDAIRDLADRLDGKPAQAIEHAGHDGEELAFTDTRALARAILGILREAELEEKPHDNHPPVIQRQH